MGLLKYLKLQPCLSALLYGPDPVNVNGRKSRPLFIFNFCCSALFFFSFGLFWGLVLFCFVQTLALPLALFPSLLFQFLISSQAHSFLPMESVHI